MNRPLVVWLLRHAETATPDRFHGAESDVELSPLGAAQAEALGRWFREQGPTRVVSSAMKRAVTTAEPVTRLCEIPHTLEPGLHERRLGELSGRLFPDMEPTWRETLSRWSSGDTAYTSDGAESYDDLRVRLMAAWGRVLHDNAGERVVIVAHGIVCKVLLLTVLTDHGPTAWHSLGRVPNVAVTRLQPTAEGWTTSSLLQVPPEVAALSGGVLTGLGGRFPWPPA